MAHIIGFQVVFKIHWSFFSETWTCGIQSTCRIEKGHFFWFSATGPFLPGRVYHINWFMAIILHKDQQQMYYMAIPKLYLQKGGHKCSWAISRGIIFKDDDFWPLFLSSKMIGHSLRKIWRLWWDFCGRAAQAFFSSPPVRWGLLDFMWVYLLLLLLLVLLVLALASIRAQFRYRTSTAIICAQCSLPDLNRNHLRPVFATGPLRCRPSTAIICAQCSLPDLNRDPLRPVFAAGPQPRSSTPRDR